MTAVVTPQDFGVPRKPWFFLQGSFWKEMCADPKKLAKAKLASAQEDDEAQYAGSDFFEAPDATHVAAMRNNRCVKVRKLRKEFKVDGKAMCAVNDVDFTMYEGEIFVLLGHNGAGM